MFIFTTLSDAPVCTRCKQDLRPGQNRSWCRLDFWPREKVPCTYLWRRSSFESRWERKTTWPRNRLCVCEHHCQTAFFNQDRTYYFDSARKCLGWAKYVCARSECKKMNLSNRQRREKFDKLLEAWFCAGLMSRRWPLWERQTLTQWFSAASLQIRRYSMHAAPLRDPTSKSRPCKHTKRDCNVI